MSTRDDERAMEEAYGLGSATAMACLGKIPAYRPYDPGTPLHAEWIRGYDESATMQHRLMWRRF